MATMTKAAKDDLASKAAVGIIVTGGTYTVLNRRMPTWARISAGIGLSLIAAGALMEYTKKK